MNAVLLIVAIFTGTQDWLNSRQFRIDIQVNQGDPLGSFTEGTIKSLAEPSMICYFGQSAMFMAGTSGPRPFSYQLEFAPVLQKDGTIRLVLHTTTHAQTEIKLLLNNHVIRVPGIRKSSSQLTRVVKPGEKIRARLKTDSPESQTWAEVVVREEPRN